MTTKQKAIVWIGIALVLAAGVYPPWVALLGSGSPKGPGGYHWLISPPSDEFLALDMPRLFIEWILIVVTIGGLVWVAPDLARWRAPTRIWSRVVEPALLRYGGISSVLAPSDSQRPLSETSSSPRNRRLWTVSALGCLLVAFFLYQLVLKKSCYMGDEIRYGYYATSLFYTHTFQMPADLWSRYTAQAGCPSTETWPVVHSVVSSAIMAPFAGVSPLRGTRWFMFAISCVGLLGIYRLIARTYSFRAAIWVVGCVAFSIPFVGYAKTLYPEIFLLTLAVWSWLLLRSRPFTMVHSAVGLVLAVGLPFFHVRGLFLAAPLLAMYALYAWRDAHRRRQLILGGLILIPAVWLFSLYEMRLFGSALGSATYLVTPSPGMFMDRFAIGLFDLRHGLLVYTPIWILAFVGLISGSFKRQALTIEALVFFACYSVGSVWSNASESMPARYWVATIPMLAVGLATWLHTPKSTSAWTVAPVLLIITLLNSALFVYDSWWFLENRTFSVTYNELFERLHHFHLGAFLPWDGFGYAVPHMEVTTALALRLLLLLAALVACSWLACARHHRVWRRIGGLASLAIVLAVIGRTGIALIPSGEYQITTVQGQEPTSVTVRFNQPEHPSLVRFGEPRQLWYPPNYPPEFVIANSPDGTRFREFRSPVRPLLPIFGVEESRVLRISESQKTSGQIGRAHV